MPVIVLALAKHGSLRDIVDKKMAITDEQKVKWSRQFADALGYLHTQGFIHRDIKPENVLVDADFDIKMASGYPIKLLAFTLDNTHCLSPCLRLTLGTAVRRVL